MEAQSHIMSDIKQGDQVSWKYASGNVEGTVSEIKTSGELAIETNGNEVKVNATEDNPAVHIARDGNDVVKRESALTKEADATEKIEPAEGSSIGEEPKKYDAIEGSSIGEEPKKYDAIEGSKESENSASIDTNIASGTTKDTEKVEIGEKRSREEDDTGETQSEEEQAEKENGKETKKAKLENGDSGDHTTDPAEDGHVSGNGHTEIQNGHHAENGNGVKANAPEEITPKKARGPGRPKKGEGEAKHTVVTAGDSTISQRTRSKA